MRKRKLNEHSARHLDDSHRHLTTALELVDRARGYAKTDPTLQVTILADLRAELLEIKILLMRARLNEADEED